MNEAEYHALGTDVPRGAPERRMSQSELKAFDSDPWSWRHGSSKEETDAMEWGSLVDCLYLTPDEFSNRYALRPATYPAPTKADPDLRKPWNGNSKWCKDWLAEQEKAGVSPIAKKKLDLAKSAVRRLEECELAQALRAGSATQRVCTWDYRDPETGIVVPLKCMIDIAPEDAEFLADFKTTTDPSLAAWRRIASRFRYDLQGAFYRWGFQESTGEDRPAFGFVVQGSDFPFPVAAYYLNDRDFRIGEHGGSTRWGYVRGFREILARYCRCLADDHWPRLNDGEMVPLNLYRDRDE